MVVVAVLVFVLSFGSMPLEDGVQLVDGAVEVVADGFIAAYLVDLKDGSLALVDATMDQNAAAIQAALTRRNQTADDVRAILLTHGHGDHIAGALAFPRASVYVLEPDVDLTEGRRVADNLMGSFRTPEETGIHVSRGLVDGELFHLGNVDVEVFAVPGHTRGSAAYLIQGVSFLGTALRLAPMENWNRLRQYSQRKRAQSTGPQAACGSPRQPTQ